LLQATDVTIEPKAPSGIPQFLPLSCGPFVYSHVRVPEITVSIPVDYYDPGSPPVDLFGIAPYGRVDDGVAFFNQRGSGDLLVLGNVGCFGPGQCALGIEPDEAITEPFTASLVRVTEVCLP